MIVLHCIITGYQRNIWPKGRLQKKQSTKKLGLGLLSYYIMVSHHFTTASLDPASPGVVGLRMTPRHLGEELKGGRPRVWIHGKPGEKVGKDGEKWGKMEKHGENMGKTCGKMGNNWENMGKTCGLDMIFVASILWNFGISLDLSMFNMGIDDLSILTFLRIF